MTRPLSWEARKNNYCPTRSSASHRILVYWERESSPIFNNVWICVSMFDCVLLCAVCRVLCAVTVECRDPGPSPAYPQIPLRTINHLINHQSSVITACIPSRKQLLTTHEKYLKEVLKGDVIKESVCLIILKVPVPRSDSSRSAF